MEAYERWQRRRWHRMGSGSEPYPGSSITEVSPKDGLQRSQSSAGLRSFPSHPSTALKESQSNPTPLKASVNGHLAQSQFPASSCITRQASLGSLSRYPLQRPSSRNGSQANGHLGQRGSNSDSQNGKHEDGGSSSFHTAHSSARESQDLVGDARQVIKEIELQQGALRHSSQSSLEGLSDKGLLKDFQEQTRMLRAQIGNLSQQNQDLRRKFSTTDTALSEAMDSRAQLEMNLHDLQGRLQKAEGSLRQGKQREQQMQRLQNTLKQLMEEKEGRLSNTAINSRAVIEKTASLNRRIEELEANLEVQKKQNALQSQESRAFQNGHCDSEAQLISAKKVAEQHKEREKKTFQEIDNLHRQLREVQKERDELAKGQSDLSAKTHRLTEANSNLVKQCKEGEEAADLLDQMNKENRSLQANNKDLTKKHRELQAKVQDHKIDLQKSVSKLKQAEEKNFALQRSHEIALSDVQTQKILARQLQTAQKEVTEQKNSLSELTDSLKQQLLDTQGNIVNSDSTIASLKGELSELETLQKSTHKQLSDLQETSSAKIADLQQNLQSQKEGLREAQRDLKAQKSQVQSLTDKNSELNQSLKDFEGSQQLDRANLQKLGAEKDELERNLQDMATELKGTLRFESDLRDELERLQDEIVRLQGLLTKSLQEKAELEAALEKSQRQSQKQSQELTATLDKQKLVREDLESQLETMKSDRDILQELHMQQMQKLHVTLEENQNQLAKSLEKCTKLETTLQSLHQENLELKNAKKNLQAINLSARGDLETAAKQLKELEDNRQRLQDTNKIISQERGEAETEVRRLMVALEEEQAVIRGVLQESQDRGLRADQIERDLEAALSEIKLYKVENTDLLRAHEEAEKVIMDLHEQQAALDSQLTRMKSELTAKQGVDQANASLKSSLNSVSKDAASMERQLEAAAAEKMGLVIALEEGKTLNNKLSQESERKALQADRLAKELESALTEAKLFTEQNTDLRRSQKEAERAIADAEKAAAGLQAKHKAAEQELVYLETELSSKQDLEQDNHSLKAALDSLSRDVASMEQQLEAATSELKPLNEQNLALIKELSAAQTQLQNDAEIAKVHLESSLQNQRAELERSAAEDLSNSLEQLKKKLQSSFEAEKSELAAREAEAKADLVSQQKTEAAEELSRVLEAQNEHLDTRMRQELDAQENSLRQEAEQELMKQMERQRNVLAEHYFTDKQQALRDQEIEASVAAVQAIKTEVEKKETELSKKAEMELETRLKEQEAELQRKADSEVSIRLKQQAEDLQKSADLALKQALLSQKKDLESASSLSQTELLAEHEAKAHKELNLQLQAQKSKLLQEAKEHEQRALELQNLDLSQASAQQAMKDQEANVRREVQAEYEYAASVSAQKIDELHQEINLQKEELKREADIQKAEALEAQAADLQASFEEKHQHELNLQSEAFLIANESSNRAVEPIMLELEQTKQKLAEACQEQEKSSAQILDLKQRVSGFAEKEESLLSHVAAINSLNSQVNTAKSEHRQALEKISRLSKDNADLNEQLNIRESQSMSQRDAFATAKSESNDLSMQVQALKMELQQSLSRADQRNKAVQDLQDQLDAQTRNHETLQSEIALYKSELEALQREHTESQQQAMHNAENNAREVEMGNAELDEDLASHKQRVEELEQEKVSNTESMKILQDAAEQIAQELADVTLQNEETHSRFESSLKELALQKNRNSLLQSRLDSTMKEHILLSEANKATMEECDRLIDESRASQTQIAKLQNNLDASNKKLSESHEAEKTRSQSSDLAFEKQKKEETNDFDDNAETHSDYTFAMSDTSAETKEKHSPPGKEQSALTFELGRLIEENDMLRARVEEYEADMQKLLASSQHLGHLNPKQKIQYHLRWKQELEELRNECTLLLRERFQLEQCIRYLAVRCGLSVAMSRDVSQSHERGPVNRLQPASLVSHHKFMSRGAHITEAAPNHISMADLFEEADLPDTQSDQGSISTVHTTRPEQAVEHQILSRVAHIVNPPSLNKMTHDPLRPALTPGALLALPSGGRGQRIDKWAKGSRKYQQSLSGRSDASASLTNGMKSKLRTAEDDITFSDFDMDSLASFDPDGMSQHVPHPPTPQKVEKRFQPPSRIPPPSSILNTAPGDLPRLVEMEAKQPTDTKRKPLSLGQRFSRAFSGKQAKR